MDKKIPTKSALASRGVVGLLVKLYPEPPKMSNFSFRKCAGGFYALPQDSPSPNITPPPGGDKPRHYFAWLCIYVVGEVIAS